MRKLIYIIVLIILVLVFGLTIFVFRKSDYNGMDSEFDSIKNSKNNSANEYYDYIIDINNHIKKNATEEEKEIIYNYYQYPRKAITDMCKKNGNWELIPIDDETYERYNQKDGILKDVVFDKLEGIDEEKVGMAVVIVTSGKKRTKYTIEYSVGDFINGINIFEEMLLVDENGIEQDIKYKFTDDNLVRNFNSLCYDGVVWDDGELVGSDIAITDKFRKKYPLFLDLFIHYSPLDYNSVSFIENKSELSKNMAYFTVHSSLECKDREYEVYYTINGDKYLDDASVRLVKEIDTEPNEKLLGAKIYYKNSNWNGLPLTPNFRSKFNNSIGTFPDIDKVVGGEINIKKIKKDTYIFEFLGKDGIHYFYLYEQEYVNNDLNDVNYIKLEYTDISINEVYDLYLKEHGI